MLVFISFILSFLGMTAFFYWDAKKQSCNSLDEYLVVEEVSFFDYVGIYAAAVLTSSVALSLIFYAVLLFPLKTIMLVIISIVIFILGVIGLDYALKNM